MTACKADGEFVRFDDPRAKAFCLLGAFFRASHNLDALDHTLTPAFDAAQHAMEAINGPDLWNFNDAPTTTREDVLRFVATVRDSL